MTTTGENVMPTFTREPLPDGASIVMLPGDICLTCRCDTFVISRGQRTTPYTRSANPNPDGRYQVQFHADWCPRIADTPPRLPCPAPVGPDEQCGAPVEEYDFHVGFVIKVPDLFGESWVEATPEAERRAVGDGERRRALHYDRLTVKPCGHVLEGEDGHVILNAAAQIRAEDAERRADETLAEHADLLTAVGEAGHRELADKYRAAVRTASNTQAGLLMALRTIAGQEP
jgi:hypothetical protein